MYLELTVVLGFFIYVVWDASLLHTSRTVRRIFWALMSGACSWWMLSTLKEVSPDGIEGAVFIVGAVVVAAVAEDTLQKSYLLTPFISREIQNVRGTPEAEGKAAYITEVISKLTTWHVTASQIVYRLDGTLAKQRKCVIEVLQTATTEELNYILVHVNAPIFVEVMGSPAMDMLTGPSGRLSELGVLARSALLDGMQKLGLRHRKRRQQWARSILLATRGMELTRLKSFLDDGGDYHTFYKLVYNDLQGEAQLEVLKHVAKEGKQVLASFQRRYPRGPPGVLLKVVSDIDDTLMCSGGSYPAGCDRRLPKKAIYPGVMALYNELDTGQVQRIQAEKQRVRAERGRPPDPSPSPSPSMSPSPSPSRGGSPLGGGMGRWLGRRRGGGGNGAGTGDENTTRLLSGETSDSDFSMDGGRHSRQGLLGTGAGASLGLTSMPSRHSVKDAVGTTLLSAFQPPYHDDDDERWGAESNSSVTWSPEFLSSQRHRLEVAMSGGECAQPAEQYMRKWQERVHQPGGHLVFLSARPESYKGYTEAQSFKSIFKPLLERGEMHGYPLLLLGSLRSGPQALTDYILGRDTRPREMPRSLNSQLYVQLYRKKLSRFKEFAALYPECCWIFVGDNGQGDVLLAESMERLLQRGKQDTALMASFINQVTPVMSTLTSLQSPRANKAAWLAKWRDHGIYFHKSFIGMAVRAQMLGLIDVFGLHHVVLDAVWTLRYSRARYAFEAIDWGKLVAQLNKDIRLANELLPDDLNVSYIRQHRTSISQRTTLDTLPSRPVPSKREESPDSP